MNETEIACLLLKVRNNQFTDFDLIKIERLVNIPKYQKIVLKLMYRQLYDEYDAFKLNQNELQSN